MTHPWQTIKSLAHRHLLFIVLAGVAACDLVLWHQQRPTVEWVLFTYVGVLAALTACEYLAPRNAAWNCVTRDGIKVRESVADISFQLLETLLVSSSNYFLALWVAEHVRSLGGVTLEIDAHWALQAIAAVLIIDFTRYWVHRWSHTNPLLWRFHAMHHMPERLGALSSARSHPIDDYIVYGPELVVLFVLGFDRNVLFGVYSLVWVFPLIIHSNIAFAETAFSRHFQLPRYHLIHHAYHDGSAATYNFSEIITLWDRLFGTFRNDPLTPDHRIGVHSEQPRSWVREFLGWAYLPVGRL